jgi:hypothetical protein
MCFLLVDVNMGVVGGSSPIPPAMPPPNLREKWNIICREKDQWGLDIEVLDIKNRCLLRKWILSYSMRRVCGRSFF